jgi:hypothetical protein
MVLCAEMYTVPAWRLDVIGDARWGCRTSRQQVMRTARMVAARRRRTATLDGSRVRSPSASTGRSS